MQFRYKRKPVAVLALPAIIPGAYDGTLVVCDDGAVFASWPDGDQPRVWVEGTPIPGTVREMNLGAVQGRLAAIVEQVERNARTTPARPASKARRAKR